MLTYTQTYKTGNKAEQDKSVKLEAFDSSYFRDKNFFWW